MEENNKINMPTLAAAIAYTNSHGGGGGGGTSNYNDLSNKPQIGGTTLTGNKSASDLGLVAAVEGKGLSTNDYTDADKAIVGGVTAALAGKQNVLTEGNNIKIDNNTISVNRWAVPAGKVVYTVITSDENYGQNVHVQRHTLGGALIDDRTFLCEMYKTVTIDDLISIYNPYASFKITLLKNSDEHQAGYSYTVNPITTPTSNSFTFMMEQEENDNDLIIRSELDEKQDTLTFDDTPTDNSNNPVKSNGIYDALELKQDATDDSLETTDKTIVGAINEHEGDISSLKSGLTNIITVQTSSAAINVGSSYDIDISDNLKAITLSVARFGKVASITSVKDTITAWDGTNKLYFLLADINNHVVLTMSYNSSTRKCIATVTESYINNQDSPAVYISAVKYV